MYAGFLCEGEDSSRLVSRNSGETTRILQAGLQGARIPILKEDSQSPKLDFHAPPTKKSEASGFLKRLNAQRESTKHPPPPLLAKDYQERVLMAQLAEKKRRLEPLRYTLFGLRAGVLSLEGFRSG